jgi:hypothetical protein
MYRTLVPGWSCLVLLGLAWSCLVLLGLAWSCLVLLGLAWSWAYLLKDAVQLCNWLGFCFFLLYTG